MSSLLSFIDHKEDIMGLLDIAILTGGTWAAVLIWAGITGWLDDRAAKKFKEWQANKKKDA